MLVITAVRSGWFGDSGAPRGSIAQAAAAARYCVNLTGTLVQSTSLTPVLSEAVRRS